MSKVHVQLHSAAERSHDGSDERKGKVSYDLSERDNMAMIKTAS